MGLAITLTVATFLGLCQVNPGFSLIAGYIFGKLIYPDSYKLGKLLLAISITGLGFSVNIWEISQLTANYLLVTAVGVFSALSVSWFLGRLLGLDKQLSALIGSGTAICGAGAIASVGTALKSPSNIMGFSLGVILVFNTIALFLFPLLGKFLGLPPETFAAWAGLAIHDTSSVIGAAMIFDPSTVDTATTVKLARAIWIAPITILFSYLLGDGSLKFKLPWFIWGYFIAAMIAPYLLVSSDIANLAKQIFVAGIFCVGASIRGFTECGFKPFVVGFVTWLSCAVLSLALI